MNITGNEPLGQLGQCRVIGIATLFISVKYLRNVDHMMNDVVLNSGLVTFFGVCLGLLWILYNRESKLLIGRVNLWPI